MDMLRNLDWDLFFDTLAKIAWPMVAIVAICIFKDPLKRLIDRLREIDWSKKLFKFGDAPSENKELVAESESAAQEVAEKVERRVEIEDEVPPSPFAWDKAASLFWLGNDMMWVQDMMYRNAPPQRVLQGLQHVKEYSERLGIWRIIANPLAPAISIIDALVGRTDPENYLIFYRDVAKNVNTAKFIVSALVEKQEPGFKKLRAL